MHHLRWLLTAIYRFDWGAKNKGGWVVFVEIENNQNRGRGRAHVAVDGIEWPSQADRRGRVVDVYPYLNIWGRFSSVYVLHFNIVYRIETMTNEA